MYATSKKQNICVDVNECVSFISNHPPHEPSNSGGPILLCENHPMISRDSSTAKVHVDLIRLLFTPFSFSLSFYFSLGFYYAVVLRRNAKIDRDVSISCQVFIILDSSDSFHFLTIRLKRAPRSQYLRSKFKGFRMKLFESGRFGKMRRNFRILLDHLDLSDSCSRGHCENPYVCIDTHIHIYKRQKTYTATLSPNVPPGVRSRGGGGGARGRGGGESSRTVKINANIQLGVGGMKEGGRNEERNVAEY